VSWRAGAVYKPRVNGSVYVGYGSSFNPSAEGLALTAATVLLDPEHTRTYEVGTKWDVADEQLSLTAAVFSTEKTNARTPGVNPGDAPTVLAGRLAVSGLELGASGRVTPRLTAFAGYSFMHSDIEESNTAAEVDNQFALTPEHTLSLWATFLLPWDLTIGGGTQYMDAVFRNATNTAVVPSYWLINGLAAYEVNRHLTLRLNLNNLTNERYVDRVGGGHYIPGPGRSLQFSSSIGF
jgi:catecholate siderophore receptor